MTPSKHPFAPSQELPVQALAMSSEAPDHRSRILPLANHVWRDSGRRNEID